MHNTTQNTFLDFITILLSIPPNDIMNRSISFFNVFATNSTTITTAASQYDTTAAVSLLLLALVLPLHASHVVIIIMQHKFHRNVYIILANLSVSDSLLAIVLAAGTLTWTREVNNVVGVFYITSVFLTLAMTLDRYLKVQHGLRYHQLATKKRMVVALVVLWVSAAVVPTIPVLLEEDMFAQTLIVRLVCSVCSGLMISVSLWVKYVRKKIMTNIARMNNYFGIHAEKFNMLKRLKGSIREMVQLSLITSGLILLSSVNLILNQTLMGLTPLKLVSISLDTLYLFSNPFVYMIVMKDLRCHYCKLFTNFRRVFGHNRVVPQLRVTFQTVG